MDDNLNDFYKKLQKYRSKNKKNCLNCNRDVGTKFSRETWESKRIFKIQCGDSVNPCDLNDTFTIKQNKDTYDNILVLKEKLQEIHIEIFQLKNKLVHEIISEELYNESFKKLEDKYKATMIDINNTQKNILLQDQQYRNMYNELKNMINENKKITETHMRINHYLDKIHELKTEVANSNELIDDNGTFQLRKRVVV